MQESDLAEVVSLYADALAATEIEEILEDSENIDQEQDTTTASDDPENTLTKSLAHILNTLYTAIDEALF